MRFTHLLSRRFLYAGLIIGVLLVTGSLLAAREPSRTRAVAESIRPEGP